MTAINFPANPSNGDTHQGFVYNSTLGVWQSAGSQTAVTSFTGLSDTPSTLGTVGQIAKVNSGATALEFADASGVTVYATADLLPGSANAGDMAFVTATNRLYLWTGTGWYNIALINTNPTISGVSSSYALAIDGTATVITVTATDPEGIPITYSIASDTSGNIATVTQGTGANTNVFTITPSTNTADAGTFSLTFRASDGVNLATAVSSFTLTFSVTNQNYTTALITTAGNAGINNSFTDSSGNSHTVSVTGDATQNSFSPYRHGGYSHYYTASLNEYHTATISSIGTSWTIEGLFYRTGGVSSGFQVAGHIGAINAANGCSWGIEDTQIVFRANGTSDSTFSVSSTTNRWIHLAFDYDGTTLTCYVNGASIGTAARTLNITETLLNIGYFNTSYTYEGYIKDMRISTSRRYTSAFTALTEAYGTDSDTDILVRNQPFIRDISSNSRTITASGSNGTHAQKPFAPYDTQEYSTGSHGGSVYLDGTGDRLTVGSTTDLGFGTGDFTIEYWIKHESKLSGSNYPYAFDMRSQDNEAKLALYHRTNVNNIVGIYVSQNTIVSGTNQMYDGMDWVHYAVCKTGGYLKGYFNGKQDFSIADSTDYGSSGQISIGSTYSNLFHMQGHIADFRVVKGTAVYTGEFTPPTAPLTAITNTSLLLGMQGAKIFDKAQGSAEKLTLAGNTTASTAAYKYLPTSMYFDGTGDYIQLEGIDDRYYDDFTVEMWVKFNSYNTSGANSRIFASRQGGNHPDNLQLIIDYSSGALGSIDVWTNIYHISDGTTNVADNNWHHVAVSRQGTSMKLFIDGTQEGSTATTSQSFLFWDTRLATRDNTTDAGSKYTGYMSDVRITKGLARYTANFTPPTAALQG